jgi:hypothetical protein
MPGVIIHLMAGSIMFFIGWLYYNKYFEHNDKTKKLLLLLCVCLLFSIIPDFFLGIFYITHIFPKYMFMKYHDFLHIALIPIAISSLLIINILNPKTKPIWTMGLLSIILHIIMDFLINYDCESLLI